MKIFSILISLMISFNLIAAEANGSRLSTIVDDFHYSVSVEWDQKDQAEFKKISDSFQSELKKVIEQESLSKADLLSFLDKKVKDKKLLTDLQTRVLLMPSNPSSAEIFSIIQDFNTSMYSQGASWGGEVLIIPAFTILLIVLIASAFANANKTCESEGGVTVTEEQNCGIKLVCVNFGTEYCHEYQEMYSCDEVTTCVK